MTVSHDSCHNQRLDDKIDDVSRLESVFLLKMKAGKVQVKDNSRKVIIHSKRGIEIAPDWI